MNPKRIIEFVERELTQSGFSVKQTYNDARRGPNTAYIESVQDDIVGDKLKRTVRSRVQFTLRGKESNNHLDTMKSLGEAIERFNDISLAADIPIIRVLRREIRGVEARVILFLQYYET